MNRTDYQDSYDDDDDSCSDSSSSHKYSLFVDETQRNEGANDETCNTKKGPKNDNQMETTEECSYSSVIRSNTRRYQDVSSTKLKKSSTGDVYSFDNQCLQSEDEIKSVRTRQTNKRKGIVKSPITVQTFFTDASPNAKNSNEDGIYSKTPAYGNKKSKVQRKSRNQHKLQNTIVDDEQNDPIQISDSDEVRKLQRKRKLENEKVQLKKMKTMSREKSTVDTHSSIKEITTKMNSRQQKSSRKVANSKNEVYITENENEDSMHQETDYSHDSESIRNILPSDCSQDSVAQLTASRKKEVNSRRRNPKSKKQQNSNSADEDEWCEEDQENFLHTLRDQPIHELTEKAEIQWFLFAKRLEELGTHKTPEDCKKQMAKMRRQFVQYTRQTGAKGKMSDLRALLISVMSSFKHVEADFIGSSSGHGIQESEIHKFNKNKERQDNDNNTDDDKKKRSGKRLKKQKRSKTKRRNSSSVDDGSDSTDSEEKSKKKKRLTNKDIVQTLDKNQKLSSKVQLRICQSLNSIADAMKVRRRKRSKSKKSSKVKKTNESDSDSDSTSDSH